MQTFDNFYIVVKSLIVFAVTFWESLELAPYLESTKIQFFLGAVVMWVPSVDIETIFGLLGYLNITKL